MDDIMGTFISGINISFLPLKPENHELYFQWMNDSRFRKYFGNSMPVSRQKIRDLIEKPSEKNIYFEIWHKSDQKAIGIFKITSIHWIRRKCSIGALIGDLDYWNRGYSTEATYLAVDYIFGELNLNKINTMVYSVNQNSQKVLEKCHFTHEATIQDAGYFDGNYCADYLYSLTKQKWKELRIRKIDP